MRYVDRSQFEIPKFLSGGYVAKMRGDYLKYLSLPPEERRQQRPPDRHLPPDRSLLNSLGELFGNRCAFCENETTLQIYRFRPTAEALPMDDKDPDAYLAYGWLADAWQNIYPICRHCRPSALNYFPVLRDRMREPSTTVYEAYAAANNGIWHVPLDEQGLLLDPCHDKDIEKHLALLPNGELEGRSERGRETIAHFNLNRKEAIERRLQVFKKFRSGIDAAVALGREGPRTFADFYNFFSAQSETALLGGYDQVIFGYVLRETSAPISPMRSTAPVRRREREKKERPPIQHLTLTHFEIESFKSLEKIKVTMPKPRQVSGESARTPALLILGENAAGKSSILEALALTMIDDDARTQLGENPKKLLLNPVFLGDADQKPREKATVTLRFCDPDGTTFTRSMTMTPEGFSVESDLPGVLPLFAYGAYRHYRKDNRSWQADRTVISLFRSDNLLSNPESWLLRLPQTQFEQVIRSLSDIFGIGGTFKVIERDTDASRCMVVTEFDDGRYIKTPLDSVSSGFRTILALACDVMRWLLDRKRDWHFETLNEARGIILIDEVEAHLHPRWKVQIMDGLRKALPNMTFIVTTHDPLCLRGMDDGEVMVLRRMPGSEAEAETDMPLFVESLTELPNVSQLTIEQLLTSDLFSLFDTDDPRGGKAMAELADALAQTKKGTVRGTPEQEEILRRFREEIAQALPIGRTQVSQLVQEAVADFVVKQGQLPNEKRTKLRDSTRNRILAILGGADARG